MPQAAKKDVQSQRAQDKESKRARGACLLRHCNKDAYFEYPFPSCKRRGCSAICPNGSLITGQGTRFVLADTEALHQKIATMSDRIRQLEDALAILHSTAAGPAGDPHPLLHRDLLKIKSSIELHSASSASNEGGTRPNEDDEDGNGEQYIDAFGTLAIRDDGAATFYGRSAGSEGEVTSTDALYTSTPPSEPSPPQPHVSSFHSDFNAIQSYTYQQYDPDSGSGSLPPSIRTLAASFPLAPALSASNSTGSMGSSSSSFGTSSLSTSSTSSLSQTVTLQTLSSNYLPPYVEALRLVNLYLDQAPWFFGAVTQRQIESELLPLWYGEAAAAASLVPVVPAGGLDPSARGLGPVANGTPPPPRAGTSHDLALLFVIFCFGFLTDTNLPSAPDNTPAEKYYQLTKAALTLDPTATAGAPEKVSRNGILERPPSVATVQTLSLMAIYEGICSGENSIESTWALMGLACKLSQSVNRDCARWKLTPAEVQKRRAFLATGRLATFSLPFVDCELPADPDQTIADDGSTQPSFPYWKARFGAECVSAVVQGTLTSRAPKYSIILDLDRKIRDMELPAYAQGSPPRGLGLSQTMSHFMPQNYRELTLLYIHRCFFAHAISTNPLDPIKSQYAPSFLAGYRSACTIVASVKLQFSMFPAQIARFWVMLASVATHSSRSKIAPAALLELKNACDVFESAASYGGRAGKFLPIMRRLQSKAQAAFRDANSGLPTVLPNDTFKPSQPNEAKDELSIFSGKTHTVSTKLTLSGGSSATALGSSSARASSQAPRAPSDSPKNFSDYPSFANAHPSLVSELNTFHGNIKAQIQNAYRSGGDWFDGIPMAVDTAPLTRGPPVRPKVAQLQPQPTRPSQPQQQQVHHFQQQHHHQTLYQQQEQLARQEMERIHMERMAQQEEERREMERQELARKQQLQEQHEIQLQQQEGQRQQQELQRQQQEALQQHQQELQRQQHEALQRQQHEALHRQQHEALQRQQHEALQQQQQEELQRQQRQQERFYQQPEAHQEPQHIASDPYHPHVQAYEAAAQHPAYTTGTAVAHEVPVGTSAHSTQPAQHQHHHRQSSAELAYQPQQQQYQHLAAHHQPSAPQHRANVLHSTSLSHTQHSRQSHLPHDIQHMHQHQPHHSHIAQHPIQAQHTGLSIITAEPVVRQQQHSMYSVPSEYHPSPESMRSASSSTGPTPPHTSYGQPSSSTAVSVSTSYVPETYKYWPAAATSFAMPDQQPTFAYAPGGHAPVQHYPPPQQHQQYTPEGALRGIAADDRSLQETWQSYMNNVGSPRQFFED
ncbi:hypothetical protein CPB84DRAFT_1765097 [Gymnopilus junonius]|uniref:Transcription factor domain-containing protein n=1 Tax=Gymnopilus junonius TaxID=109634 RepID=A0A9P5NWY2_GYMJU|nr:hypothetical protein CPB84DRAFT_1765097 [Gymnopilus junonius]